MSLKKEYVLDKRVAEGCIGPTIENGFDMSWHRDRVSHTSTIEASEIYKGVVDDGKVIYNYNSDFFRCDEFSKEVSTPHILFAGCSETEGIGGNVEDAWPSMFLNNIKDQNKNLYCIARSGWGWEMIIDNIRQYIDRYSKPEYLFILLPNVSRRFEWDTNIKGDYCYWQRYPLFEGDIDGEKNSGEYFDSTIITNNEYFECLIRFMVSWRLFLDYCKQLDIKVLWSTWFYPDRENLESLKMLDDSYVEMKSEEEIEFIQNKYLNGWQKTNTDLKKRDGHSGILRNLYWSEKFYMEANKRWGL